MQENKILMPVKYDLFCKKFDLRNLQFNATY